MKGIRKVLHIAGGVSIQKLYQNIFVEFSKRGFGQDVYVPCNDATKINRNKIDLPHLTYCFKAVGGLLDRVLHYPKIKKHFAEIEKVFDTNYSYCFAYTVMTDGSLALKLKKRTGVRYSVFVRNTDINIFYRYFYWLRPLFRAVLLNAEYINFPNPSYEARLRTMMGEKFAKEIGEKIRIVPNGIDDFWHEHRLPIPNKDISDPVQLIFVGKIDENKNVGKLVEALKILNKRGSYVLTLIGKVSQEKEKELGKWQHELKGQLAYLGEITSKELLMTHYRKADMFVMPSKTETFGLVYIEALTQGLPILYTEGEGVSGFFRGGTVGLAVKNPNDETEIASKITQMSHNYRAYAKGTIPESARFKWEKVINLYIRQMEDYEKA